MQFLYHTHWIRQTMKGNLQQVLFIVVPYYEGNSQLIRVPQCVYLDVSVIFHAFFVISTYGRKVRESATLEKITSHTGV